jgi:DNA-binding response OmpR family regulator
MAHRLLVIDDSLTIRKLVEISLRGRGFTVDYAATGRDGIECARRDRPDLILLDFVLPDMKGSDVCRELAHDGPTATCPIIVLTGKQAQIRELFKDLRQVVDYVSKPFSPEDLAARVERALVTLTPRAEQAIASTASSTAASFRFTLFAKLRAGFVEIPAWMHQLGDEEPGAFFSNRVCNEARLGELFEALVPIYKQTLRQRAREPEVELSGTLELLPARRLLDFLGESGKTGELSVVHAGDERVTRVFLRGGELVLASSTDPSAFLHGALALDRLPADLVEQAQAEQRRSGKPMPVTLAAAGVLSGIDVTQLLHGVSCRLLAELLATGAGSFSWRKRALPSYVETHARVIALAGLELERLRAQVPEEQLGGQVVCARAPQFSERVRRLVLDASETRVLAHVDGVTTTDELAALAGLAAEQVSRVSARLLRIGLLQVVPPAASPVPTRLGRVTAARVSVTPRQVMVLEPDERGFRAPLLRRLAAHRPGYEVLSVGESDAVATLLRDRPALVLINASAHPAVTLQSAREIAARPELSRTRLVAVLDTPEPAHAERLAAAGCDVVLTKPVHILEIERLLVGEPGSHEPSRTDAREVR